MAKLDKKERDVSLENWIEAKYEVNLHVHNHHRLKNPTQAHQDRIMHNYFGVLTVIPYLFTVSSV